MLGGTVEMLPETETETGTVGCTVLQALHPNNLKLINNTAALKTPTSMTDDLKSGWQRNKASLWSKWDLNLLPFGSQDQCADHSAKLPLLVLLIFST